MKIAITNPTTWPRVRRGAERFLNELACFLAARGHQVTVISTKPGRREEWTERGYRTVCHRRLWHPSLAKAGVLEFHAFLLTALGHLLRERFDVVHCCTFTDAYAASLARRVTGVPYVFWINALPPKVRYIRSLTLKGAMFRRSVLHADEVISLSRYMQSYFQNRFGRGGVALPVPVDIERFRLCTQRDAARPIILCAAALDDARKGGELLFHAFDRLKAVRPEVRLQVSCNLSEAARGALIHHVSPKWHQDVEFLGAGQLDDLPAVFGRAAVSVLPSLWEAFGMVMLESLSTGTPVVGTRDGAIPEVLNHDGVGRLFEPFAPGSNEAATSPQPTNLEGLTQALLEGLELSRDPQTALRCRAHAEHYSWAAYGPRFEELYARCIAARRERGRRKGRP